MLSTGQNVWNSIETSHWQSLVDNEIDTSLWFIVDHEELAKGSHVWAGLIGGRSYVPDLSPVHFDKRNKHAEGMREAHNAKSPLDARCLSTQAQNISFSVRGQSSTALDTLHEGTIVKSDKSTSCSVQLFRHGEMKMGQERTEFWNGDKS